MTGKRQEAEPVGRLCLAARGQAGPEAPPTFIIRGVPTQELVNLLKTYV